MVTSVGALDLDSVLASEFLELLGYVLLNEFSDFGRVHVRNGTDRELANDLGGHNSLVARAVESTLNAVKGQGWVSPAMLQNITHFIVDIDLVANSFV